MYDNSYLVSILPSLYIFLLSKSSDTSWPLYAVVLSILLSSIHFCCLK